MFQEKHGVNDVVYVNPAYDIERTFLALQDLNSKKEEINKLKFKVDVHKKNYMEENDCDEAKYKEIIMDPARCPKDAPKRKAGFFSIELCGKVFPSARPINPDEIDRELKEINN